MMTMTVAGLVDTWVQSGRGDAPAFIIDDEVTSFAALTNRSRRVADGLYALGIRPGDRLGIWLPNCIEWAELFLACARLGVIAVALNTRYGPHELADILARSGARFLAMAPGEGKRRMEEVLLALDPAMAPALETILLVGERPHAMPPTAAWRLTRYPQIGGNASPLERDLGTANSEVLILTTSGTTRQPKLVTHTQAALVTHACDVAEAFDLNAPGAVGLALHPLFGALGHAGMMAGLASGAPTVMPGHFEAAAVAASMRRHRVTSVTTLDSLLGPILDAVDEPDPFPDLRLVGFGSYDSSPVQFARERLEPRGICAIGTYGMSEIQAMVSLQPPGAPLEIRVLAGGRMLNSDACVRVRDPDTGEVLPHDTPGEIEFRCPSMMSRYFGDEAATMAAFTEDGFLRSGDAGTTHPDGSFRLLGRMGDALRLGGFLVNSVEISDFVASHSAVRDCQVVGIRLPQGLRPVAFVIIEPNQIFKESDLAEHCAAKLAIYKRPVAFLQVDEFPTTASPNGLKVQRAKLREMAEAALT